jgi:hypothetical protein
MKLAEDAMTLSGDVQSAWDKLVDWSRMHEWDVFLEHLHFNGPLGLNSVGRLKMKDGPEVDLVVTQFDPPHSYTDEFSLLGSKFIFHHYVAEAGTGEVTVRIVVEAEGLAAALLAPLMRRQFAQKMPLLMQNFRSQYERT